MPGMETAVLTYSPSEVLDASTPGETVLTYAPGEVLDRPATPSPRPGLARRVLRGTTSAIEWLFGALSVVLGLSILAAVPVLQFLSLGYLLEASGRVARTGRVRDGLIGFRPAARVGGMVLGCWLVLLPLRLVASLATSADVIDPGGPVARAWKVGVLAMAALTTLHLVTALARGGRLRNLLWPFANPFWLARRLRRGGLYVEIRDGACDFLVGLRLPYYFRLGLAGFVGTLIWLLIPATLIAAGRRAPVVGLLGALLMGVVAMGLPFLQTRFATEGRFRALFETKAARERFRRAPWAFAAALFAVLASAVPLYLLKIEMVPREAAWLPSLVFVAFLYPARLFAGWAYSRSGRREARRHWTFRGLGRLGMLPTAAAYVGIVFLAQYTSWGGLWTLYEQHAFLLPVPFLGI